MVGLLGVAIAYWLGAEVAWGALGAPDVIVFFPPAGVTLAAVVLAGRRWPAVCTVVLAVELLVNLRHGVPVGIAAGYAVANAAEPAVGGGLLLALSGGQRSRAAALEGRAGMGRFLIAAVGAGPLVGALLGALAKRADGSDTAFLLNALHWWAGDALGVLTIGAALLLAAEGRLRILARRPLEAVALAAVTAVVAVAVFRLWDLPFASVVLPLLLWAALRFDAVGVAVLGSVLALAANMATAAGRGPFAVPDTSLQAQLGATKVFLGVALLTAWFFSIESDARLRASRRERAERLARLAAERDRAIAEAGVALAAAHTEEEVRIALADHAERYPGNAPSTGDERRRTERVAPYRGALGELGAQAMARVRALQAEASSAARLAALQDVTAALAATMTEHDVERVLDETLPKATGARVAALQALARDAVSIDRHRAHWAQDGRSVELPLVTGEGVAAVLVLRWATPQPFGVGDRAFLLAVGEQCAQALERARLREAEHDAVLRLQRVLLAQSVDRTEPAFTVERRYRPAASPLRVGGDWFDAVQVAERSLVLIVGDVVGRGMAAAMAMGQLRSAARALARRCAPAVLLEELDRFAGSVDGAPCCTVAVARIDAGAGLLTYSLAGHPPPLLRRAGGAVHTLDGRPGMPIGVAEQPRPQHRCRLGGGDTVFLYTDGLIERRTEPITDGLARLAGLFAAADLARPDWVDAVIDGCLTPGDVAPGEHEQAGRQGDDLAVLAARLNVGA
ncbi:MAG: SpoIIE family protein phosphatase [Acidimicrobiales bacterium]